MADPQNTQSIQLGPNDLQLFEYSSQRYDAVIAQGVKLDQILAPEFWAHHAVKLRPMNEIRARSEDGTWVAYLLVLDCSRTWARLALLSLHPLTTSDVSQTQASSEAEVQATIAAHEVGFNQGRKWYVKRKSDNAILQDQMAEKDVAKAWLAKYARDSVGAPSKAPEAVTS